MYGQTEATARISYLPFEVLGTKIGSIGIAIPNGTMQVDPDTGELMYIGPNVMLGYAESRDDLSKGGTNSAEYCEPVILLARMQTASFTSLEG